VTRVAAAVVVLAGCVCAGRAPCEDLDGDGFGKSCPSGPDCDDTNQDRTDDCDTVPPADCSEDPTRTGCPCIGTYSRDCYEGPDGTLDVGPCAAGRRTCVGGYWGRCVDDVLPENEHCNEVDDDCDGLVDDGVLSPCGGCDPACDGEVFGAPPDAWDPQGDPSQNVGVADDGALVLAGESSLTTDIWIANSADATVSRLHVRTGVEKARYRSGGPSPSRTAVDYRGDAYVANRAFDAQGTVTKIAAVEDRCPDRDSDGAVDTSTGGDDVLADGEDECVLYTVSVGGPGAIPRALAIDGELGLDGASAGMPWVGLHGEEKVVRLDGEDGSVLAEVATPGVHPYGAAIDGAGALWVTGIEDGRIARVDTTDPDAPAEILDVGPACDLAYGVATDAEGNVWIGGWACADLLRLDPRGEWTRLPIDASARGVAVDDDGDVWVAHTGGSLTHVSSDPLAIAETIDLAVGDLVGLETVGVAVDLDGRIWAVSREGAPSGNGLAFRLDPPTGALDAYEVGRDAYTYSDMTGHALRSFVNPTGFYRHVFLGCNEGATDWVRLHWDAVVPPRSALAFEVRRADDVASLGDEPFEPVAAVPDDDSPAALDLADGGVLEVRIGLETADRHATPRVATIGLEWVCPGPD